MKKLKDKNEIWYGVYDQMTEELIYLYKDQISAINQARRGTSKWVLVKVELGFDSLDYAIVHNCRD